MAPVTLERAALGGIAVASVYVVAMIGSSAAARATVRTLLEGRGLDPEAVMVAPVPANPLDGTVVVVTREEYLTGRFNWLASPRVELDGERVPRPRGALFDAAARAPEALRFLVWSRFPAIDVEMDADGTALVRFSDMRYRGGERLLGPNVKLDRDLRLVLRD
jgi:hypothetical protein